MMKIRVLIGFAIVVAIGIAGIGCGGQLAEANKLVEEANAAIKRGNDSTTKSTSLINELFGSIGQVEDLEAYKTEKKSKIDELLKLFESSSKEYGDAGSKFEAASKLDVSPKFKEYLALKGQEIKKRAEHDKMAADLVKGIQAENDPDKVATLISDFNEKSKTFVKDADDLLKKADQIVKDNASEFKGN